MEVLYRFSTAMLTNKEEVYQRCGKKRAIAFPRYPNRRRLEGSPESLEFLQRGGK